MLVKAWSFNHRTAREFPKVIILEVSQVVATKVCLHVYEKRGTESEKWQLIPFLPSDQAQLMALTTEWPNKAKFNCMFETWEWAQLHLQPSSNSSAVSKVILCIEWLLQWVFFPLSGVFGSLSISQLYLTILFYSRRESGKGTGPEVGRLALPPHCLTLNIQLNWLLSAFYL